jgi:hypothetical protein
MNSCPEGKQLRRGKCFTVECPAGFFVKDGKCTQIVKSTQCPLGYHKTTAGACLKCGERQTFDEKTQACVVTSCPDGFFLKGTECFKVTCGLGQELRHGKCITVKCPPGFEISG